MPDNIPKVMANLIRSCWQKDPDKRPSIDEIASTLSS